MNVGQPVSLLLLPLCLFRKRTSTRVVRFLASGGAKFPKMRDSLPSTPLNRRAKFDAASFILAGGIRNRTNKSKQTVNDISTPCLSACVDNRFSCPDIIHSVYNGKT